MNYTWIFTSTVHRIGFSRPCLSISTDHHIESVHYWIDQLLNVNENLVLSCWRSKNSIEFKRFFSKLNLILSIFYIKSFSFVFKIRSNSTINSNVSFNFHRDEMKIFVLIKVILLSLIFILKVFLIKLKFLKEFLIFLIYLIRFFLNCLSFLN